MQGGDPEKRYLHTQGFSRISRRISVSLWLSVEVHKPKIGRLDKAEGVTLVLVIKTCLGSAIAKLKRVERI